MLYGLLTVWTIISSPQKNYSLHYYYLQYDVVEH